MTVGDLVNQLTREASTLPQGMETRVVCWLRLREAVGLLDLLAPGTVQVGILGSEPVAVLTLDEHARKEGGQ